MARVGAAVAVAALLAAGCGRMGPGVEGIVDRAAPGSEELRLTYLGTGGWIMRRGDDMVLAAPFFSNPSFVATGLTAISSDTAEVDRQMAAYDVRAARAILVGHAHYDHLMDVPRIAKHHAPNARIVGSRTMANALGSWSGLHDRIDVIDDSVADVRSPGRWMRIGPGVRILPLRSVHAPHFDGYTLYDGSLTHPLEAPPRNASGWLDGATYAYLVDFLDPSGDVAHRIYYQDAVSAPPFGFAPEELIAERPVDVAIFVPATFDQVDWHPEAFVENLRPRRVLLGHWEDFFIPVDAPTRAIRLSDIGHFQARLERVFDGPWWRPEIGTEFRFGG